MVNTDNLSSVCQKCLKEPEAPCRFCGIATPAGRGGTCENCYWDNLTKKRIEINCKLFESSLIQEDFFEYGTWLLGRVGGNPASQKISRHLWFFKEIESTWGYIPSYSKLLTEYGAEGLRRARLPMRWLQETDRIRTNKAEQSIDSENRRIDTIFESIDVNTLLGSYILQYRDVLLRRVRLREIKINTARMALTSARGLLNVAGNCYAGIGQKTLNMYLRQKPGQKASLSGFVGFLNKEKQLNLILPDLKSRKSPQGKRHLESKIVNFRSRGSLVEVDEHEWILICLEYFHSYKIDKLPDDAKAGSYIKTNGRSYWIPSLVSVKTN